MCVPCHAFLLVSVCIWCVYHAMRRSSSSPLCAQAGLEFARPASRVASLPKGSFLELKSFIEAACTDGASSVWDRQLIANVFGMIECTTLRKLRNA